LYKNHLIKSIVVGLLAHEFQNKETKAYYTIKFRQGGNKHDFLFTEYFKHTENNKRMQTKKAIDLFKGYMAMWLTVLIGEVSGLCQTNSTESEMADGVEASAV
jgi:hypothetical protein